MTDAQDEAWVDDKAGRLVRLYTVSNGRTRPSAHFDLLTQVMATGIRPNAYLGPDYEQVLDLCGVPLSVAEVAAHMQLPAVITKVLLSDLVQQDALTTRAMRAGSHTDRNLLEAVLNGLRKRL